MAVVIPTKFRKSVSIALPVDAVYTYVSHFETSIPQDFPGIESFVHKSNNQYRWEFKQLSYSGYSLQFIFVTSFKLTPPSEIMITPAIDKDANRFEGAWRFSEKNSHTELVFEGELQTQLPIPFFVKAMAAPIIEREIGSLFERYLSNVAKNITK